MGSHSDAVFGYIISQQDIDEALGVWTDYPGKPASVVPVTRYDPKTGIPITKDKKVPGIPAFRHLTITYEAPSGPMVYVDRIHALPDKGLPHVRAVMSEKTREEAKLLAGLPPSWQEKAEYSDLMETLAADHGFECQSDWDDYIIQISSYCSRDFVPLSWLDQPAIRAEIQQLGEKLRCIGFKNPECGVTAVFYE